VKTLGGTYYSIKKHHSFKPHLGCPRVLRTDLGTENAVIAYLQPTLRHFHADSLSGINSHHYGKSTADQVHM
jgi:hypothetical protein